MSRMDYREFFRRQFEEISSTFDFEGRVDNDPIRYTRSFSDIRDREASALIASAFAYGNVNLIIKTLDNIFKKIGEKPSEFLKTLDLKKSEIFDGFYYRFNNADDLKTLLWSIGKIQVEWGSLENLFLEGYKKNGENFTGGLELFSGTFLRLSENSPFPHQKNFNYLFPTPSKGSPCKRLCLFLRWMNRSDNVDPGGWSGVKKSDLIIPLDTHIARIGRYLGFTSRKNADWKMAVEITDALKEIDPEDPLKYDFVLCHLGISGECPRKFDPEKCSLCVIRDMCVREPSKPDYK
jgi:uncharacterized protein (TIGR02757 family)